MRDDARAVSLFDDGSSTKAHQDEVGSTAERLARLDLDKGLRTKILRLCRLKYGEVWEDPLRGHKVGVLDATRAEDVAKIMGNERAKLVVNDPPYNLKVGKGSTGNLFKLRLQEYLDFSRKWVRNAIDIMEANAHLYVWMGGDYRDNLEPLPDFIILMREFREVAAKSLITVRNQRGYGTQNNWMWVRQELLYYVKGSPSFNVDAEYTDIPKVVRGYYKSVGGRLTENAERSRSQYIRAGNVWVDIQQVFYRMEENVPGCYAQKPLKAIERVILSGTGGNDLVVDFFSHSGTTLIAGERLGRKVQTFDLDPIFAEITIRRLLHYRETGRTGWQWQNPFPELDTEIERRR